MKRTPYEGHEFYRGYCPIIYRPVPMHSSWCTFRYVMEMGPRERRARREWIRQLVPTSDLREACEVARRKATSSF